MGQSPQYCVYLFLLEECKITQAYVPEIRSLNEQYRNDSIEWLALFPNPSSSVASVQNFLKKYGLALPWAMDADQKYADQFNIAVMPEVIVWDNHKRRVLYKGRINNLFAHIGKRRNRATEHDLRDVLDAIVRGQQVVIRETQAVGCLLTRL